MPRSALSTQILALNSALIAATVFAASVAAAVPRDLTFTDHRQFLVLIAAILATVLVNAFVLRRRFAGLEHLVDTMEHVDLTHPEPRFPQLDADSDEVARLRDAFTRMLMRLQDERTKAASAVLAAQEQERARIARDLHDEVNQALTGVLLRLQATTHNAPPELADELHETQRVAAQAMQELRNLAHELRPVVLDDIGLSAALRSQVEEFSRKTGVSAELVLADDPDALDPDAQLVAYRVAQESLSNVARHAGATRVRVEYCDNVLRVLDDGRGITPGEHGGHGLAGMRERALQADGRLHVHSRPDRGTTVELLLCAS